MEKKILIFAATYNEAENINPFLENILKLNINLDLLRLKSFGEMAEWLKAHAWKVCI